MEWVLGYVDPQMIITGLCGYGIVRELLKPSKWRCLFITQKLYNRIGDKEYFPLIKQKRLTDYGYIVRIKAPVGITSESFIKVQTAIEEMLIAKVEISYNNGYIFVKVFEKRLCKEYAYKKIELEGLKIPIGYTYRGLKIVDLAKGEPHMLVAGETGSGKSTLLRAIITNLILNASNVVIHLIDLKKGVELSMFKDCKMVKSFSKNIDEAKDTLTMIQEEVNRRYELFYENSCKDFDQYVKKGHKLKRWIIIVDEFSIIVKSKGSVEIFEELSAIARACGVHLLLCTQRPDAKVVTGLLKQNIPLVIGLKCLNGLNSRIIIDQNGLEDCRGQGHGLLKSGGELVEFQSMNLEADEAERLLGPFKIKARPAKVERQIIEKDIFDFFHDN